MNKIKTRFSLGTELLGVEYCIIYLNISSIKNLSIVSYVNLVNFTYSSQEKASFIERLGTM